MKLETHEIFNWFNEHICPQSDHRPILWNAHINGGYLLAADGYAMARVHLSHIDIPTWMDAFANYMVESEQTSDIEYYDRKEWQADLLPVMSDDKKEGRYPDVQGIYLRAWRDLGIVDMVDVLTRCWQVKLDYESPSVQRYNGQVILHGVTLAYDNLFKLLSLRLFWNAPVTMAQAYPTNPDDNPQMCVTRFSIDAGIELYIQPMFD